MSDLLSVAVNAQGGLSRWHQLKTVKAQGFSGCRTGIRSEAIDTLATRTVCCLKRCEILLWLKREAALA
jgi:hypothetical protein